MSRTSTRAHQARPPSRHPHGGATRTADPEVGGLHVLPGGRAYRRLRPKTSAGARGRDPRSGLRPRDRQGAAEGEHHALLLQVSLKDNARVAKPGVWPAAALPADLELQLAIPTTLYDWLQAFHDLRCRGRFTFL